MFKINLALCVFFAVLLSPIIISAIQINQNSSPVEVIASTNPVLTYPFPQKNNSENNNSSASGSEKKLTISSPSFPPKSVDSVVLPSTLSSSPLVSVINSKGSFKSSSSQVKLVANKTEIKIETKTLTSTPTSVISSTTSSTTPSSKQNLKTISSLPISSISSSIISTISSQTSSQIISSDIQDTKSELQKTVKEDPKQDPKQIVVETTSTETMVINAGSSSAIVSKPKAISTTTKYEDMITQNCATMGCNPNTVIRIMKCESSGNQNAKNGMYTGLFQFAPATFSSFASSKYANLPNASINSGADQVYVASWMMSNGYASQWSCQ